MIFYSFENKKVYFLYQQNSWRIMKLRSCLVSYKCGKEGSVICWTNRWIHYHNLLQVLSWKCMWRRSLQYTNYFLVSRIKWNIFIVEHLGRKNQSKQILSRKAAFDETFFGRKDEYGKSTKKFPPNIKLLAIEITEFIYLMFLSYSSVNGIYSTTTILDIQLYYT